jgi:hypothetical protein
MFYIDVQYGGWFEYERGLKKKDENIHHIYYEELKLVRHTHVYNYNLERQCSCS